MNQERCRRANNEIVRLRYSSSFNMYICECRKKQCLEPLTLTREQYLEIRRDPRHFIVAKGHGAKEFERVVHETAGYDIVSPLEELAPMAAPRPSTAEATGQVPSRE